MQLDEQLMWQEFEKIQSWDDWRVLNARFFNEEVLEEIPLEEYCALPEREDQVIDGILWHFYHNNYRNLHAYFLYTKTSLMAFRKMEPEAAADNDQHPERYSKDCFHCQMWTKSHEPKVCPQCGGELLLMALPEDD